MSEQAAESEQVAMAKLEEACNTVLDTKGFFFGGGRGPQLAAEFISYKDSAKNSMDANDWESYKEAVTKASDWISKVTLPDSFRLVFKEWEQQAEARRFYACYHLNYEDVLGNGQFGKVFGGFDRAKEIPVAIKVVEPVGGVNRDVWHQKAIREVDLWRSLRHPFIVPLYDSFVLREGISLVLELREHGTLEEHIESDNKGDGCSEKESQLILHQLASALAYMHERDVVHRDIKPLNILVSRNASGGIEFIQLSDFGTARATARDPHMTANVGTSFYAAPEVAHGAYDGAQADVYSAGMTALITLFGRHPFPQPAHVTADEFQHAWYTHWDLRTVLQDKCPPDILKRMVHEHWSERPTMLDVLADAWVKLEGEAATTHRSILGNELVQGSNKSSNEKLELEQLVAVVSDNDLLRSDNRKLRAQTKNLSLLYAETICFSKAKTTAASRVAAPSRVALITNDQFLADVVKLGPVLIFAFMLAKELKKNPKNTTLVEFLNGLSCGLDDGGHGKQSVDYALSVARGASKTACLQELYKACLLSPKEEEDERREAWRSSAAAILEDIKDKLLISSPEVLLDLDKVSEIVDDAFSGKLDEEYKNVWMGLSQALSERLWAVNVYEKWGE